MKVFDNKHIKNVVFVGAHRSGKTTLSETMLFEAGLLNRRGTVEQQNTVSDYHEIEHQRGASVFATPLHTEWRNYKINIIDTPGLDDFIGEIISSIRVADTIVTVVNGEHGVDTGTEIIWNYIDNSCCFNCNGPFHGLGRHICMRLCRHFIRASAANHHARAVVYL